MPSLERAQDFAVEISDDDGTTFVEVGYMTSWELAREFADIEANHFGDFANASSLIGMFSWSLSNEAFYVYGDAGQVIVEAQVAAQKVAGADPYTWRLTSRAGTVGAYEWTGQAWITSRTMGGSTDEVVTYNIDVKGTGALTRAVLS